MSKKTFSTVEEIVKFVKPLVEDYRHFDSHKNINAAKLRPLFEIDAEPWKRVVDSGKFKITFSKALGKKSMKALKKLLYVVDEEHYQTIKFVDDDDEK
ncbi:MAG: hypothetical protein LBK75_02165 [Oscillospiraceae bacterium]|jgi:hypothetical protein|nr:hypothetical protein [Oscillospiraceae bacterium]